MISYQGLLTDASGQPISDGTNQITIRLYESISGGTSIYSETHTVATSKGIFNLSIGSVTVIPASVKFDKQYYIGISLNADPEFTPRTPFTSVPYAFTASTAQVANSLSTTATGVVTSINTQSGSITLQGGGGTTVNKNGNVITISSSTGGSGGGIQGIQNTDGSISVTNPNGPVATISVANGAITSDKLAAGVIPTSLPPSGGAGGDLAGSYPNPQIATSVINSAKIIDGSITAADIASGVIPTALPPTGAAGGDLNGTYPNPGIGKLQGRAVSSNAPSTGQVLLWTGSQWAPGSGSGGWSLAGNAGTTASSNFVGTTDSTDLVLKTKDVEHLRITAAGKIQIANQGTGNNFIGQDAGKTNTTGTDNIALGFQPLKSNTVGSRNIAIGTNALSVNTSGSRNTAMGYEALGSSDTSWENTAIGYRALHISTGGPNTAVGTFALYDNTLGAFNTAIGYGALSSITTGSRNTALGHSSLTYADTANYNTSVGEIALFNNKASYNTALGFASLYTNTFGLDNTAIGTYSMFWNTTGNLNFAGGKFALYNNTTGNNNTAVGVMTLPYCTTGSNNTALGIYALGYDTTGSNNTAVGYNTGVQLGGLSNTTCLGYQAQVVANNTVRVGNSSITSIGGQVGWTTLSDERAKVNIAENVVGLNFILKLRPVTYQYSLSNIYSLTGNVDLTDYPGKYDIEKMSFSGFLAQDVELAANASGYSFSGIDLPKNDLDYYGLRYSDFVVPIVKAIQEQQKQIDSVRSGATSNDPRLLELETIAHTQQQSIEELRKANKQLQEQLLQLQQVVSTLSTAK